MDVFDAVGRATAFAADVVGGVEIAAVVVVVVVDAVVAFSGDVDRRCASKILSVSLVGVVATAIVAVGVVAAVDEVKHGVFITSRRMFGIDVGLAAAFVDVGNGLTSTIDGVGSVTTGAVTAAEAAVTGTPLATSSITSSMCDRVVSDVPVDGTVVELDAFSPLRLADATMFETIVIRSLCCVDGVEVLTVGATLVGGCRVG